MREKHSSGYCAQTVHKGSNPRLSIQFGVTEPKEPGFISPLFLGMHSKNTNLIQLADSTFQKQISCCFTEFSQSILIFISIHTHKINLAFRLATMNLYYDRILFTFVATLIFFYFPTVPEILKFIDFLISPPHNHS